MPDVTMTSWPMATDYFTGSPSPVRDVSYSITGIKGSTRYFYWVVANYSWGSVAPIAPLIVANAPDVLGVTGSVVLSWIQPSNQIVNYTVLRSTTAIFPGNSTTAIIVNTTNTTVTDSGAALVAATFTAIPAMRGVIYIDGTGPIPVLISNIGMQVAGALSATGPVSGSTFNVSGQAAGTIPIFRSYTVTLVGTNWQITAPDGTVTTVPTVAATVQEIPLANLPPNVYFMFIGSQLISGPVTGVSTARVTSLGTATNPGSIGFIGLNLEQAASPNSPLNPFLDVATTAGRIVVNTPETLVVEVTTSGGNVNNLVPPCAFIISVLWGVTN